MQPERQTNELLASALELADLGHECDTTVVADWVNVRVSKRALTAAAPQAPADTTG